MQKDSVHLAVHLDKPETSLGDKYIEAERRLAELFGWTNLSLINLKEREPWNDPLQVWLCQLGAVPMWTRDNASAFALMVGQHCEPIYMCDCVLVASPAGCVSENYDEHHDKESAVRFAIVKAVIAKLESGIKPNSPQAT